MTNCTLSSTTSFCNLEEGETTLPIPGFPNYHASDHGRIFRIVLVRGEVTLRPLKPYLSKVGYFVQNMTGTDGKKGPKYVHRLVAATFLPDSLPGQEVRHLDGSRTNNRAINLAWGSRWDNVQDMIRHGTMLRGERNPAAILSEDDVIVIRYLSRRGTEKTTIGKLFGIAPLTVRSIVNRETWDHVPDGQPLSA